MQLIESHPTGIEPKDKKHTFDEIGLTRTIGSDNGSEIFMERSDLLSSSIRLEIFQDEMVNDKAGFVLFDQN